MMAKSVKTSVKAKSVHLVDVANLDVQTMNDVANLLARLATRTRTAVL